MATKIMIVDDEPAIGKLLLYQLSGFGYQVSYLQDGLLALRSFLLQQPDLILLDVMMPQISGWEVCRQIRACSTVPVIMLTAKGADPDVVAGLSAGADDYIVKPFSMAQLQARIEAVLRRTDRPHDRREARPRHKSDPHLTALIGSYHARTIAPALPLPPPEPVPPLPPDTQPIRLGDRLREARLARGLSLHQVERICKIRWEFLQAIEQENWSYVPRAQLRPVLRAYSGYLGLDPRDLAARPKPQPEPQLKPHPFPIPLAAVMAVVVVLVAVGLYLL